MTTAFYVDEDRPARLATVHQTGGPCQVPQRKRARDGQWHGPFRLKEGALSVALLALNTLRSETEQSEHKGFAALLKGCFGAVRDPLAHEPKILWEGEDDAADYLSLVSLLHRKLDDCVHTGLDHG